MSVRGIRGGGGGGDDEERSNNPKPPRFTAQEKGKFPITADQEAEEGDLPPTWDWRNHRGAIGSVLNQKRMAICWAIALVRAIQALLNIGLPQGNQFTELSVQHVVNKVKYEQDEGIKNIKRALDFAKNKGICIASQCKPNSVDNNVAKKLDCKHPDNINTHKIDDYEYITDVDDIELQAIVRQQPVIGILRNTGFEFSEIGSGIYKSPTSDVDISFHEVLVIGYGFDSKGKPYWIIQSSYGEGWGVGGFGYVYRRIKSGQGSEFFGVAYPKKRGYPREEDGA